MRPIVIARDAECWNCGGEYLGQSESGETSVHGVPNKFVIKREGELEGES